ncbi:Uma2 family endonuclease [Planctomyces sp. SH-PL62]|uniref:Uma2 family endonuclease n=1 Tax=Planctomyces sp. SH-PL62 TaxID=1636152 RepID=UPI00078EAE56|nr:Uma2 family endonuclease [Planctomyces sp. SH-PL62]AMV36404.1 hypothetical protein VT85_03160 [Planctomyces sp. SH-PL62]
MSTSTKPIAAPAIPILENGDRLSRAEFERRYAAMPAARAELIEGIVYMASPVRFAQHGEPHAEFIIWLGNYKVATPGLRIGDNASVRLDLDNEPQPDICLFLDPERGGQAGISEDGYIEGAPELVAEVASSSVSIDLGPKLDAYRRNGVREYLVWRVLDGAFDWFVLREERFEPLSPDSEGILKSLVFPGLWLDPTALLAADMPRVLAVLNQGVASPEHAAFVERLRGASA